MNDDIETPFTPEAPADKSGHRSIKDDGINVSAHPIDPPAEPIENQMLQLFNRQELLNRLMGDEQLASSIIEKFLDDMIRQIEALKNYVERKDTKLAGNQAHQIKGVAGNVGSISLQNIAASIEKAAKAADLERLKQLMPKLKSCFDQLQNAMLS